MSKEHNINLSAMQLLDAVSIAAALSKDMRDGESLVAWVKRVIQERETAKASFERIFARGQCTGDMTGIRLTDCQNIAWDWLKANIPNYGLPE